MCRHTSLVFLGTVEVLFPVLAAVKGFASLTMSLDEKFTKAVWLIRNGPPKADATNEEKLDVYAMFKQATVGDVTGSQPYKVQFEVWSPPH